MHGARSRPSRTSFRPFRPTRSSRSGAGSPRAGRAARCGRSSRRGSATSPAQRRCTSSAGATARLDRAALPDARRRDAARAASRELHGKYGVGVALPQPIHSRRARARAALRRRAASCRPCSSARVDRARVGHLVRPRSATSPSAPARDWDALDRDASRTSGAGHRDRAPASSSRGGRAGWWVRRRRTPRANVSDVEARNRALPHAALRRLHRARARAVAADAGGVRARSRALRRIRRREGRRGAARRHGAPAARVRLSPQGPRPLARVDPPQRLGDAHLLPLPHRRRASSCAIRASGSRRRSAGATLPDVLSVEEVQRLLAAPTLDDTLVFRDRALLELAYGAGLRVSEWITLGVRDLLLEEGLVRVFGKGSKERLVPIGRSAIGAVAIYLRELRPQAREGRGEGHPLPQRAWAAAHAHGRLEDPARLRRAGGDHEARHARTPCGTPSPRISSRAAPISARSRRCLGTWTSRRRRSTPTSIGSIFGRSIGVIIREVDRPVVSVRAPVHRMLLVIDNYDSFTYNLVQYLGELGRET